MPLKNSLINGQILFSNTIFMFFSSGETKTHAMIIFFNVISSGVTATQVHGTMDLVAEAAQRGTLPSV